MISEEQDKTLLDHLRKKEGYYKAILELAEEEFHKLTRRRPLTEVVSLMKKKQILLSCIEECDQSIEPLKTSWKETAKEKSHYFEKIKDQLHLLDVLIREILGLDDKNRKLFEERLCSVVQK